MELLRTNNSFRQRLEANTARIKTALRAGGIALTQNDSPIVSIVPATKEIAALISRRLLRAGIFPPLIRYGGDTPHGRFRFAISQSE